MGIPRLTQDLNPYTERIALGRGDSQGLFNFQRLIIDGPSLVYFVYNKLLAVKLSHRLAPPGAVPTYLELNNAVLQLLVDLEEQGVER